MLADGHQFLLSRQAVHIWRFPLEAAPAVVASLEDILSPDECERAARFGFDHLRISYICGRGALRHLLGRYLRVSPSSIRFAYGPKGKPALADQASLQFNLAHAGKLAAAALTVGCEIGVDLEPFRPLPDLEQVARRFFCPEETAEILSLPSGERERAFFLCWTRKEAYIKAVGEGLALPLINFRVTVHPGDPARLLHIGHSQASARAWTLEDLFLAPDFAAAIAYRDRPRTVTIHPILEIADLLNTT
jgi:4'-phosphopantetheinyl transferase